MAALDSYSMFICFKNWNMRFDAQILYIVLYQGVFMATAWDSAAANIQERSFVCSPQEEFQTLEPWKLWRKHHLQHLGNNLNGLVLG
jgi:hypothetical protein